MVFFLISSIVTGFLNFTTADLLTVVTNRIARARNRSGTAGAAALHLFKAFDRI